MDSEKENEDVCCIRREQILVCESIDVAVWYLVRGLINRGQGNLVDLSPCGF